MIDKALAGLKWYFATLGSTYARQLVVVFGLLFLLGAVVFLLQRWSQQYFSRALGWKGVVYWTGWLGVPIHELSHAIVGYLFRIEITEIKLFEPDPESGVLGYVRYKVPRLFERKPINKESWTDHLPDVYWTGLPSVIGTFLMGIAPLFGGSLVLLLLLWLLAPDSAPVFKQAEHFSHVTALSGPGEIVGSFFGLLQAVYGAIFSAGFASWRPWLFLYLAIAVGGHLAPSRPDLEGGVTGLVVLLLVILGIDAVAVLLAPLFDYDVSSANKYLVRGTGPLCALLLLAAVVNAVNLALAFLTYQGVSRYRRARARRIARG